MVCRIQLKAHLSMLIANFELTDGTESAIFNYAISSFGLGFFSYFQSVLFTILGK